MTLLTPAVFDEVLGDFSTNLVSLPGLENAMMVVYGSAARPDFDPARSDVNLLLVPQLLEPGTLGPLSALLQLAQLRFRCAPLVLDRLELERMALLFPVKIFEIRRAYRLLAGEDLVASLDLSVGNLQRACERDLRNASLKLRRAYLRSRPDPAPVLDGLRRFLPQMLAVLRILLEQGGAKGVEDPTVLAREAKARLDLDPVILAEIMALRHKAGATWPEVESAHSRVLELSGALLAKVAAWAE